jgi:hypothetical protein
MNTQQFPEIAKAVGAQRGGKYLKRVAKPGGGYRYIYKPGNGPKGKGEKGPVVRKLSAKAKTSVDKINGHIKNAIDTLMSGEEYAHTNAKSSVRKAKGELGRLNKLRASSTDPSEKATIGQISVAFNKKIKKVEDHIE